MFTSFQYILQHPVEGEFRVSPRKDELEKQQSHLEKSPATGIPLKDTLLTCALLKYFFRMSQPRLVTREQID